jgi:hypothetical protein
MKHLLHDSLNLEDDTSRFLKMSGINSPATHCNNSTTTILNTYAVETSKVPTLIHVFMQVCLLFLSSSVILTLNPPPPTVTTASHHTLYKFFIFNRHYNPSWVSACSTIVEHSQQESFTECCCQQHVKPYQLGEEHYTNYLH